MTIAKVGQLPNEVLRQDTTDRVAKVGQVVAEVSRQNTLSLHAQIGQLVVEVLRQGDPVQLQQPQIWIST